MTVTGPAGPVTGTLSATVTAPVGDGVRGVAEGGAPVEAASLPELGFVHPMPGFPRLRRFALVRLDGTAAGPPDGADGADGAPGVAAARAGVTGDHAMRPDEAHDGLSGDHAVEQDEAYDDTPVVYELRSLEQPSVRFLVGVPTAFFPEYAFELDDHACEDLALTTAQDALVLVVLSVGQDAASTTANLLAPVVINARTRHAAQVILSGTDWPVRAPLG